MPIANSGLEGVGFSNLFSALYVILYYMFDMNPLFFMSWIYSPCLITIFSVSQSVSSVTQSCPTLCDPMDCSTPGLPVHHQLPEFTQTHVNWVSDAIQPSQPKLFNMWLINTELINGNNYHHVYIWGMIRWKTAYRIKTANQNVVHEIFGNMGNWICFSTNYFTYLYTYIEQAPGVGDGQGSWRAAVQGVTKSRAWLSDWNDWLDTYVENVYEIAYKWKFI